MLDWVKNQGDKGYVAGEGSCDNGCYILAEAGGKREAELGRPMVGDAGAQLNATLKIAKLDRREFRIHNVVPCRPPRNWLEGAPWEQEAIEHYRKEITEDILRHRPKVIIPVGNVALKWLLGFGGILKRRGYVYETIVEVAPSKRGDQIFNHQCYIVPTYHPSYLIRGKGPNMEFFKFKRNEKRLTQVHAADFKRAVKVAQDGYQAPKQDYITDPTLDNSEEFVSRASRARFLTADIETIDAKDEEDERRLEKEAKITRISFAYEPHHSISIPWENKFVPHIQKLFKMPFEWLVWWNGEDFDIPILREHGIEILSDRNFDAMWAWHFLQSDLPKGLGFVSSLLTELPEWKSLASINMPWYSCCDADAQIQNFFEIKRRLE